jgi:hypothetical protein
MKHIKKLNESVDVPWASLPVDPIPKKSAAEYLRMREEIINNLTEEVVDSLYDLFDSYDIVQYNKSNSNHSQTWDYKYFNSNSRELKSGLVIFPGRNTRREGTLAIDKFYKELEGLQKTIEGRTGTSISFNIKNIEVSEEIGGYRKSRKSGIVITVYDTTKRLVTESIDSKRTLRDVIGDVKSTSKKGYRTIIETTKGCFSNMSDLGDHLDDEFKIYRYSDDNSPTGKAPYGDISTNGFSGYVYIENNIPKIITYGPGDERGCVLFGDVFVASGHDGNYLWNIKTGEFMANTW